jgi:L-fuconolactonase
MKIDAHQHFWRFHPVRESWITDDMLPLRRDFLPDELRTIQGKHGIQGSVAVQADQSEDETHFLLQLAESHPFILGVVGWVDLLAPRLRGRLEYFSGFEGFCGVRHIAQAEADDWLAREEVVRGIGQLQDFGLTYDILVYPNQLPAALSLVERLPHQSFVLDHMAKPLIREGRMEPWAGLIRELASHSNVWCKVSGLVTEADWGRWRQEAIRPYLDVVFEAFGPDRLMFGSDWPVCLLAASYEEVCNLVTGYAAPLPEGQREKLFGGNAVAFYGLGV